MARIVYSAEALDDLERLFNFLLKHDPSAASASVEAISSGIDALAAHPFAGRRVRAEIRELVISFGRTGYVALYRFLPARSEIPVLRLRHQRELDFPL